MSLDKTTMNVNGTVRIEVLGRDNYDTWKIQMKALLIKNDAWGYVSGSNVKPEDNAAEDQEWTNRDEKAKSDLILSIGASQLKMVKNCATSRELWQKLEDTFQSRGPARKASLLKNLTLKKMNEGDDIHEHLHEFFDSVDKLAEMDVNINDDLLAIMLLYSLPASFENFRVAIESRDVLPTPDNLRTNNDHYLSPRTRIHVLITANVQQAYTFYLPKITKLCLNFGQDTPDKVSGRQKKIQDAKWCLTF